MTTDPEPTSPATGQEAGISADLPLQQVIGRAHRLLDAGGGAMPKRFCFQWEDIAFTVTPAEIHGEAPGPRAVSVEAFLGRLPYTAEDAVARSAALKLATPEAPGIPGQIKIDRAGTVRLAMETGPVEAIGLADVLKEVTVLVVKSASQLRHLRSLLVD